MIVIILIIGIFTGATIGICTYKHTPIEYYKDLPEPHNGDWQHKNDK